MHDDDVIDTGDLVELMVCAYRQGVEDGLESENAPNGDLIMPDREWSSDWEREAYASGCEAGFRLQEAQDTTA